MSTESHLQPVWRGVDKLIFDVKLTSGANSVMIAVETNEYPLLDVR